MTKTLTFLSVAFAIIGSVSYATGKPEGATACALLGILWLLLSRVAANRLPSDWQ